MKNHPAETYEHPPSEEKTSPDVFLFEGRDEALDELRLLLLEPEQKALRKLQERIDNPKKRAYDISRVLPQALVLCSSQNAALAKELTPQMDKLINASIGKNSKIFIKKLSRMIGPATRSAISEKIQDMNTALSHSFSLRGLKWRWEAFRTGKTFAEVVMLHNLIFRVEQVFLIHKETGLLLQNIAAHDVVSHDADLVSGMLTAIQDFVKDSFKTPNEDGIETLQVGELSVWIEEGPHTLLAAVIRGQASLELRTILRDVLENIYLEKTEELETFQGDNSTFEEIKPYLEICLESRYKSESKQRAIYFWTLLTMLGIVISVWIYFIPWRDHQRWTQSLNKLREQPGIIITSTEKHYGDYIINNGTYIINGLRDALAPDPKQLLTTSDICPENLVMRWKPYYAMEPEFILDRSKQVLQPPESIDLTYENGALKAQGSAPHQWITETRILARAIPGVFQFWGDQVVDTDLKQLNQIKQQLEIRTFYFKLKTTEFSNIKANAIDELLTDVHNLLNLSDKLNQKIRIQIKGHTDSSGTELKNSNLSLKRAQQIRSFLVRKGISPAQMAVVGVGASEPQRQEATDDDRQFNRRVTFRVISKLPLHEK
ncbi:OmpA family protein [Desulfococcaceae bacterium HSG7]|nr:OmpA family protein [Desulfococcaceae bacterium HSG7]